MRLQIGCIYLISLITKGKGQFMQCEYRSSWHNFVTIRKYFGRLMVTVYNLKLLQGQYRKPSGLFSLKACCLVTSIHVISRRRRASTSLYTIFTSVFIFLFLSSLRRLFCTFLHMSVMRVYFYRFCHAYTGPNV